MGLTPPKYAHVPLILNADRTKLSKRQNDVSSEHYIEKGYLPEALLNFLALIGWNPGTDKEIFTLDELLKEFSLEKIQKSGGVFNVKKLNWINKEHMKMLSKKEIEKNILENLPEDYRNPKVIPVIIERISKWSDVGEIVRAGELDCFFKAPEIVKEKLAYKNTPLNKISYNLELAIKVLSDLEENNFTAENIKNALMLIADNLENRGMLLHPVRYALSGRDNSPDPFIIASILGKNETMSRLQKVV